MSNERIGMRCVLAGCVVLSLSAPLGAQTAPNPVTIAVFPPMVTDPAVATPVQPPVTYAAALIACNQVPKLPSTPGGTHFGIDDPANPTGADCRWDGTGQLTALAPGNYQAAAQWATVPPSAWSTLAAITAAVPQAHPCDVTPPTAASVIAGTHTISWCWNGLDVNGNAVAATSFLMFTGAASAPVTPTVGTTANAAGKKLYSVTVNIPAGTTAYQLVIGDSVGPSAASSPLTITATAPLGVPSTPTPQGVQ